MSNDKMNNSGKSLYGSGSSAFDGNVTAVLALSDNFESLYDVNLETGEYELYIRGQTFYESVKAKLIEKKEFFEDTLNNINRVIYAEDRAGIRRVVNREYIRSALNSNKSFEWLYRMVVNDAPVWFRMRLMRQMPQTGPRPASSSACRMISAHRLMP